MSELPTAADVTRLLGGLLSRDVTSDTVAAIETHTAACHGLVDNDNNLRYVIGADLAFAHRSGAALAMLPAGVAEDAGTVAPDEDLLEIYAEVANLTSRAVNEASYTRVRLDPGLEHDPEMLRAITATDNGLRLEVKIAGYGNGHLGIWSVN